MEGEDPFEHHFPSTGESHTIHLQEFWREFLQGEEDEEKLSKKIGIKGSKIALGVSEVHYMVREGTFLILAHNIPSFTCPRKFIRIITNQSGDVIWENETGKKRDPNQLELNLEN